MRCVLGALPRITWGAFPRAEMVNGSLSRSAPPFPTCHVIFVQLEAQPFLCLQDHESTPSPWALGRMLNSVIRERAPEPTNPIKFYVLLPLIKLTWNPLPCMLCGFRRAIMARLTSCLQTISEPFIPHSMPLVLLYLLYCKFLSPLLLPIQ